MNSGVLFSNTFNVSPISFSTMCEARKLSKVITITILFPTNTLRNFLVYLWPVWTNHCGLENHFLLYKLTIKVTPSTAGYGCQRCELNLLSDELYFCTSTGLLLSYLNSYTAIYLRETNVTNILLVRVPVLTLNCSPLDRAWHQNQSNPNLLKDPDYK